MVGRVTGVEEPLRGCVCIVVAACTERRQHSSELGKRHRDVGARRLRDQFGPRRQPLGGVVVASHRGHQCGCGVGSGRHLRIRELLGEPSSLVSRGRHDVQLADAGGGTGVEHQQARQVPESAFSSEAVDCRCQEVGAQVERTDDERRRAEEAGSVRVRSAGACFVFESGENRWCVTPRFRVRVDRDDARVLGVCIAESIGGADQGLSDFGIRIHPPGTGGDEPQQIDVQVVVARGAGLRCCFDEGLVSGGVERASQGRLLDPRHSRAVELAEITEIDLS